jgi:hypothetical protein
MTMNTVRRYAPLSSLPRDSLCRNNATMVSANYYVISTAGRNLCLELKREIRLRSLTSVRDDNALSRHCDTVSDRRDVRGKLSFALWGLVCH